LKVTMQQPSKKYLAALFLFCLTIKVLPFVLMHLGTDLSAESVYPWSFTPIFAVGLVGLAMFSKVRTGLLLPLSVWIASDMVIAILSVMKYGNEGLGFAIYPGMWMTYLSLMVSLTPGLMLRYRRTPITIFAAALLAPTLFFLVSNYGAWVYDTYGLYPRTVQGLQAAYTAGLPFYRNSLISTLMYAGLLFSPVGLKQMTSLNRSAELELARQRRLHSQETIPHS
jgi:hypothetical protein